MCFVSFSIFQLLNTLEFRFVSLVPFIDLKLDWFIFVFQAIFAFLHFYQFYSFTLLEDFLFSVFRWPKFNSVYFSHILSAFTFLFAFKLQFISQLVFITIIQLFISVVIGFLLLLSSYFLIPSVFIAFASIIISKATLAFLTIVAAITLLNSV